jgi:hypothetical protein
MVDPAMTRRPMGPIVPLPPHDPDLPRTYTEAIIALHSALEQVDRLRAALAYKNGLIADLSADVDKLEREREQGRIAAEVSAMFAPLMTALESAELPDHGPDRGQKRER